MAEETFAAGEFVEIIQNTSNHSHPVGTRIQLLTVHNGYKRASFMSPTGIGGTSNWSINYADIKKISLVSTPKIALDSVVLSDSKKEEIRAAMSQIENSKIIFEEWGFADVFEKGTAITLLFYGIPGTGKTLMAQAIADELGAELKIYGTADIQSSEPGGAERTIRKIFDEAKSFFRSNKKQRVVLFDECDSLLYDRNKVGVILGAQINAMLTEIERHDGIIIFTTNRMGKLDPALERRIAAKIEFPFPDKAQREAIWKRMIPAKAPLGKDVDFDALAEYPLAGGNIKNAVLNAARKAAYLKSNLIMMKHFKDAIEKESISAQAFSAAAEGDHNGQLGDVHMEDNNKIVVGNKNINIKETWKGMLKKGKK